MYRTRNAACLCGHRGFESHPLRHAPPEQFSDLTRAPQGPGTSGLFAAKLPYCPLLGPVRAGVRPPLAGQSLREPHLVEFPCYGPEQGNQVFFENPISWLRNRRASQSQSARAFHPITTSVRSKFNRERYSAGTGTIFKRNRDRYFAEQGVFLSGSGIIFRRSTAPAAARSSRSVCPS